MHVFVCVCSLMMLILHFLTFHPFIKSQKTSLRYQHIHIFKVRDEKRRFTHFFIVVAVVFELSKEGDRARDGVKKKKQIRQESNLKFQTISCEIGNECVV